MFDTVPYQSYVGGQSPDYRLAKRAALSLIQEMGIADPPVDPILIASSLDVRVHFVTFDSEREGVSGFYDCEEDAIFVNRHEFPLRQTFTVAHELGHKVLHEEWARSADYQVLLRDTTKQNQDYREREANVFAAELLMPKFMMDQYRDLPVEQLSILFAVSVPAMRTRVSFLYE